MTNKLRLPHYFSTSLARQITELYASTAIADFALAIIMLFEPIFMFSVLGFSVQQVLWFFAGVYAAYILFIPFGAKIANRFGYEHAILYSIFFQISYWLLIFSAKDYPLLIWVAAVVFAIEKSLFWPAFHASVARFAGQQQRGREFSVLLSIVHGVFIIGPVIGGMLSHKFGFGVTFVIASVIYFCSFIPLFTTLEVFVPKPYLFNDTWNLYKQFPTKFLGYLGFGEELLVLTIWPIFIYVVVKEFDQIGLLVTAATLISTLLALYIGKVTDQYQKRFLIKVGSFFYFLVWVFRSVATGLWGVFALDSLSRTSKDIVFIPLSALTYERANATHIMPYAVFFEQSLAVGKLLACLLGVLIFSLTGSFVALFGLGALFTLLYMFI